MVINLATHYGQTLHQMDVKIFFINVDLKEEVCMPKSSGFKVEVQYHQACKLIKILYGLKRAPRAWHAKMDGYL
jgi:hypothetical protein